MASSSNSKGAPVVIIGAGISGICMAVDLIRRNGTRNFIIIEKSSDAGGTWNDNRYPGCCADAWSHLYSYSFNPNPDWMCTYPTQREIHAYLSSTVRRWDLFKHIVFNTTVESAEWSDTEKIWRVVVTSTSYDKKEECHQDTIITPFLVSAVGQLSIPSIPDIAGLDNFKGKVMHSSRWDESQELKGKRIAIFGNGATGIQMIPGIAKLASHLTVFQRTPNWVLPRNNQNISLAQRLVYKFFPHIRERYRERLMVSQDQVHDMIIKPEVGEFVKSLSLDMMKRQIPGNGTLREKLTPNYPYGCKRVVLSDEFYPAMNQAHVELETRPVDRITERGIIIDGEETDFDILILATGFRTTEFMHGINIVGNDGRDIRDIWRQGGRAYLGMTVESLPNFAMLYGPNTNLSHSSVLLMIESQARYISAMIGVVQSAVSSAENLVFTVKKERVEAYNQELQLRLHETVFAHRGCSSWYKTKDNIVTNNWPDRAAKYQQMLMVLNWNDYEVLGTWPKGSSKTDVKHFGLSIEEELRTRFQPQYILGILGISSLCMAIWRYRY
ncbi:5a2d8619-58a4-48a4-b4d6-828b21260b12 [Sclerotinia trifoliorum]|uniref:5a2d8619-58a4-48a4-b4d6-828b21260b12 n=1 Tax=Sclerotinia trifoliorum TaxID=28548 RepID=A0A8H2VWN3_9HELO|nr:5a2d8619-58a4-48a4-b4d6-828b21260b12 [Sclerotinia trifoliorum]